MLQNWSISQRPGSSRTGATNSSDVRVFGARGGYHQPVRSQRLHVPRTNTHNRFEVWGGFDLPHPLRVRADALSEI